MFENVCRIVVAIAGVDCIGRRDVATARRMEKSLKCKTMRVIGVLKTFLSLHIFIISDSLTVVIPV